MDALDDQVFRDLVAARGHALLRSAYLLTGDRQRAQDLTQTALEKTIRHWSSVRRSGAVEAYVRRTMYREHISIWRRTRGLTEIARAEVPEPRRAPGSDDRVEDRLVLQAALQRLAPRQRAVILLRFYEDLSEQQIADELQITVGTVKSTTHRALAKLRDVCGDLVLTGGELR